MLPDHKLDPHHGREQPRAPARAPLPSMWECPLTALPPHGRAKSYEPLGRVRPACVPVVPLPPHAETSGCSLCVTT